MDDTVQQAMRAARANTSLEADLWDQLLPSERTTAIYREMRRIDAQTVGRPVSISSSPVVRSGED